MSGRETPSIRIKSVQDMEDEVICGSIPYKGDPHFAMYWPRSGRMILLDPADAQVVYRDLGKFLHGEVIGGERGDDE